MIITGFLKSRTNKVIISLIIFVVLIGACVLHNKASQIVITQYADKTGSQAMFYTIETGFDGFIVIDGGMAGNAEYVRSIIEENGNHVTAWILTHPHPDHIGAFNTIYGQLGDITIDTIYAIDMDYNLYQNISNSWDDFEGTYVTFCRLTEKADNLQYLYAGDELQIGKCRIKIYSAYDETIINYSKDIANNGSLVFEVFGKEESMLFCSDVYGDKLCNKIIESYGDEIGATYIQMGHHGNNSITRELYGLVKPQVAFFDAPDWLVSGANYDTRENIAMAEEFGSSVYTYFTAPNQIIMK